LPFQTEFGFNKYIYLFFFIIYHNEENKWESIKKKIKENEYEDSEEENEDEDSNEHLNIVVAAASGNDVSSRLYLDGKRRQQKKIYNELEREENQNFQQTENLQNYSPLTERSNSSTLEITKKSSCIPPTVAIATSDKLHSQYDSINKKREDALRGFDFFCFCIVIL
jgi:hypothetical protein